MPLRDGPTGLEVLMLKRNRRGTFGGMWVFPGGQVDPADGPTAGSEQDEILSARTAAVREAREEAGIDIDPESLVVLSFWFPPPEAPKRFATWFFLAPVAATPEVVVDQVEIHDHDWMSPAGALERRGAGQIELAPPTFITMWWLEHYGDVGSALSAARSAPPGRFETHMARSAVDGNAACLWAGDAGYDRFDMDVPGPRRRLVLAAAGWQVEIDG